MQPEEETTSQERGIADYRVAALVLVVAMLGGLFLLRLIQKIICRKDETEFLVKENTSHISIARFWDRIIQGIYQQQRDGRCGYAYVAGRVSHH